MIDQAEMERGMDILQAYMDGADALAGLLGNGFDEPSWDGIMRLDPKVGFASDDGKRVLYMSLPPGKDRPDVGLFALTRTNYPAGTPWDTLVKDNAFAFTLENGALIAFREPNPLSPLSHGLVMMHEIRHAWRYISGQADTDLMAEELTVTEGDVRVMKALLGAETFDAIARPIRNSLAAAVDDSAALMAYLNQERDPVWNPALLEPVFGPELSEDDYRLRRRPFFHAALSSLSAQRFGENGRKVHIEWMRATIGEGHFAPQ